MEKEVDMVPDNNISCLLIRKFDSHARYGLFLGFLSRDLRKESGCSSSKLQFDIKLNYLISFAWSCFETNIHFVYSHWLLKYSKGLSAHTDFSEARSCWISVNIGLLLVVNLCLL